MKDSVDQMRYSKLHGLPSQIDTSTLKISDSLVENHLPTPNSWQSLGDVWGCGKLTPFQDGTGKILGTH